MVDVNASKMPESPKAASSQDQLLGTKDEVQDEPPQKFREVSPVPLVVSDIVRRAAPTQRTALPSSKPTEAKEKNPARDNKRARDSDKLEQGVRPRQTFPRRPRSHVRADVPGLT